MVLIIQKSNRSSNEQAEHKQKCDVQRFYRSNLLPFCNTQPYGACYDEELKVNLHYPPKLTELLINRLERC